VTEILWTWLGRRFGLGSPFRLDEAARGHLRPRRGVSNRGV